MYKCPISEYYDKYTDTINIEYLKKYNITDYDDDDSGFDDGSYTDNFNIITSNYER